MWYVVSSSDIIAEEPTYRQARQACLASCLDGRKYPDIRRIKAGLYAYEQSSRALTSHRKSYLIGTQQALTAYGIQLEDLGH